MAVDTLPDGFPTIPILATARGNELYSFLKDVFEAVLLDRHDAPDGEPAYMTVRIGDSRISVMKPLKGRRPTSSAFYIYVADVDLTYRRALDAGAVSTQEPIGAIHGDRMGTIIDPFGNQWTIASCVEHISIGELHRRLARQ